MCPFVQVQFIFSSIGREINIRKSVVIQITDSYTSTVIKIFILQNIMEAILMQIVSKIDTG